LTRQHDLPYFHHCRCAQARNNTTETSGRSPFTHGLENKRIIDLNSERAPRRFGLTVLTGSIFEASRALIQGRSFHSDEQGAVILSYAFWKDRFLGSPEALGRRVQIGNQSFVVVGVAPERFTRVNIQRRPSFYLPIKDWPRLTGRPGLLMRAIGAAWF
jgi:hypothetical protein